jgi:hypothetical protein
MLTNPGKVAKAAVVIGLSRSTTTFKRATSNSRRRARKLFTAR